MLYVLHTSTAERRGYPDSRVAFGVAVSHNCSGLDFGILFFVTFSDVVTSHLYLVVETRVPGENHRLTPSHWQSPACEKVTSDMTG